MPKLEDLLKAKGWTDAEIADPAYAPLLSNPKFRSSLETEIENAYAERDLFKGKVDEFEQWRVNTAIPKFDEMAARETTARQRAATLEEQIKIAKDYGYLPPDTTRQDPHSQPNPAPVDPQQTRQDQFVFDPAKHNLVTRDEIGRFANLEGEAIAMASDLAEEYRMLYPGQSLLSYEGQNGKRGMRALREEAVAAKQNLDQYIGQKFNFQGKRAEVDAKRKAEAEEAIRKDERAKVAQEYRLPGNGIPTASRHPLIPVRAKEGGQPWEKQSSELRERRLSHALTNEINSVH